MKIGILGTGVVGQTIGTNMNTSVMVDLRLVPGDNDVFVLGSDASAKARVTEILLPIWLRLRGVCKTPIINFHIARP